MSVQRKRFSVLLGIVAAGVSGCPFEGRTGLEFVDEATGAGGATGATSASQSIASSVSMSSSASTTATAVTTTGSNSSTGASVRRPFLVGSSLRSAGVRSRTDWLADARSDDDVELDLDPATKAMLAKAWLDDAVEEHASVAAFARWTLHMLSVGAPPNLIRESQLASLDEVEHARDCFALARRYGAGDIGPGNLDLSRTVEPLSLVDIAILTAEEGCAGETLGVAVVMEQARQCGDPAVLHVLARLLRDEERHAWLTWAFIAWAIREGGSEVREAVVSAIARATAKTLEMPLRSYEGIDVDAFRRHGRITCREARDIVVEAEESVLRPAVAML